MKFQFSNQSLSHLHQIHPDLKRVVFAALESGAMDFTVIQGARTLAEQQALYAQGRTEPGKIVTWIQPAKGKHLIQADGYGHAVDLAPYPVDWNNLDRFHTLAAVMKSAALRESVTIRCGADWPEPETDLDHYELVLPAARIA